MKDDAINAAPATASIECRIQMVGPHDVHEQAIARPDRRRSPDDGTGCRRTRTAAACSRNGSCSSTLMNTFSAVDRIEIVEDAEGQPQRTEMPRGLFAGVEHRHRDGLDVAVFLLEGRNLTVDVLLLGVPFEGQHAATASCRRAPSRTRALIRSGHCRRTRFTQASISARCSAGRSSSRYMPRLRAKWHVGEQIDRLTAARSGSRCRESTSRPCRM